MKKLVSIALKKHVYKVRSGNVGDVIGGLLAILLTFGVFFGSIAAWFTHVIVCLSTGAWGFLVAGAIVVPIAVIHGVGYWFGFFH